MSIETSFHRLAQRAPTAGELEHLRQVKERLGLAENDAIWDILVALDYHRTLYEDIPRQVAAAGTAAVESARVAFDVAARAEASRCHRNLAELVATTSLDLARSHYQPLRWRTWSLALACMTVFGAVCAFLGQNLSDRIAFLRTGQLGDRLLSAILELPAGWILLLLLVPCALSWARDGWMAVRERAASPTDRAIGWGTVILGVAGAAAGVLLLAKLL